MKKIVCLILIAILLLSGCNQPNDAFSQAGDTEPSQEIDETALTTDRTDQVTLPAVSNNGEAAYEQQTMYAVSMPIIREYQYNNTNELIFSHSYQNIHIVHQDPDVANAIIVDYLNRIDNTHERADEISTEAQSEFIDTTFYHDVFYSPTRIDQVVLSFAGKTTSYSGADHSMHFCHAANYNMLTGDTLTLGSILTHIDSKDQLIRLVIQEADRIAVEKQLYADYAVCIEDRFSTEESFDEDWYFTQRGIVFFFQVYEIAPYSSGIITVEIPYENLTGIIADDFFPPEEELFEGDINCSPVRDTDLSIYTQMAEVIINADGEDIILFAEGAVRYVRIEYGMFDSDGTSFTPICTIFAAGSLTPQDGIIIKTYLPEVLPELRISYRTGNELRYVYLNQSGEDGTVFLSA